MDSTPREQGTEQEESCARGGLNCILTKLYSQKGLSSLIQAPGAVLELAFGSMGQWSWQWGNG